MKLDDTGAAFFVEQVNKQGEDNLSQNSPELSLKVPGAL